MAVKLVAKQGFTAYGKDYPVGKWPENAMAKRLNNGFLEYRDVEEDSVEGETNFEVIQRASNTGDLPADAQSVDQDPPGPEFHKMSTDDLTAFVAENDMTVDLSTVSGIRAQRAAVREAYAAKLAAAPVGGTAGGAGPAA
jgi:hypothetical protein